MINFSRILTAEPRDFAVPIPPNMKPVDASHVTLLSRELSRAGRDKLESMDLSCLPPFPALTWGPAYLADNGKKCSLVRDAREQEEVAHWVALAVHRLGLGPEDVRLDPSRVYHVSVANMTGSPFDSVADPWNHRVG